MSKLSKDLAKHPKFWVSYEGAMKDCTENSAEIEVTSKDENIAFYCGQRFSSPESQFKEEFQNHSNFNKGLVSKRLNQCPINIKENLPFFSQNISMEFKINTAEQRNTDPKINKSARRNSLHFHYDLIFFGKLDFSHYACIPS